MARVIIAGGRTFNNYPQLVKDCDAYLTDKENVILTGCAKGADALGERYALERGYAVERYPANWGEYGKKAGYIRNVDMANNADTLIAFWNDTSKGTKHMIDIATKKNLNIFVSTYP